MFNSAPVETQPIVENSNVELEHSPEQNYVEEVPEAISQENEVVTEAVEPSVQDHEGELPEFAKRRLGREQKKYERQIAALKAEMQAERERYNSHQFQAQPLQGGTIIIDPLTKKPLDLATPKGQERYEHLQEVNEAIQQQETERAAEEARRIDREMFEHVSESFEDAKERHADFSNVMTSSGLDERLVKEMAHFNDPGSLAYYIASNPQEVARLKNLPAYMVKRELARHLTDMVSKKKLTNAPIPVNRPKDTPSGKSSNFKIKSVEELMAAKREAMRPKKR